MPKKLYILQVLINMRLLLKVFTKNISNKDPLSMHRTGSNETALVSEFPYMISDEHVINALGPRKNQFSF